LQHHRSGQNEDPKGHGVVGWQCLAFEALGVPRFPAQTKDCAPTPDIEHDRTLLPSLSHAGHLGFLRIIPRLCCTHTTMAIERMTRSDRWDEERDGAAALAPSRPLTREEAEALRQNDPPLSPWRVVAVQAAVGSGTALLAALVTGRPEMGLSTLYGAATVVVPGALMARGMTSRLSSMSPGASAVSFMAWETVKITVSVAMLMVAPRLVQPLSWPALLVGLVLCMKVYWLALLWRGRRRN
jgi:ATP synthase protein I